MFNVLQCVVCFKEQVPATDATVNTAQGHGEAEGEEVTVVKMAHTVIQPRTMMVHFQNAPVTDTTVVRSCWFRNDAFFAD